MRVALALVLLITGCAARTDNRTRVEFWALGREGEVVVELVRDFERQNPDIHVDVQQMPWTASHEKLLTSFVGDSTPDVSLIGNSWIPEFEAIGAIADLTARAAGSKVVDQRDYFAGIWATNLVDEKLYGIPWYVDTRVMFYRSDILRAAGFPEAPKSWSEWVRAAAAVRGLGHEYAILLPTNEWTQPVALGLQVDAPLLAQGGRYGAFSEPRFRRAFDFYLDFFERGDAPVLSNTQVANVFQQFAEGEFAMYITGPWQIGEFRRRLPENMQDKWMTAALPAPDEKEWPGTSLAGGGSLVIFERSERKDAAWKLIEFLSAPEQQVRFFQLCGDLPARRSAWSHPVLANDKHLKAFRTQLENVKPTPAVPQWEQIATTVFDYAEAAIRGRYTAQQALKTLDDKTNAILEKRRWMLDQRDGS